MTTTSKKKKQHLLEELSNTCSQIFLKCLYLERNGRPDILWSVNKLARSITKWTKACDKRLGRLISYIHHTSEHKQYCHVGMREDTVQNVLTAYSTDRVCGRTHNTPRRSTTQHSTSWRSATDAILPGHREHTGGSRQDTHGTPVLTTVRRPWVAQPHEHARADARDTQCEHQRC